MLVVQILFIIYCTIRVGYMQAKRAAFYINEGGESPSSSFYGYMYAFSAMFMYLPLCVPAWLLVFGYETKAAGLSICALLFLQLFAPFFVASKDSWRTQILMD